MAVRNSNAAPAEAAPASGGVDFTKPLQTQAKQRQFKDGKWGPYTTNYASIAPGGKGLVIGGYQLQAGHRFAFAFPVGADNVQPDWFKFVNELVSVPKGVRFRAAIGLDNAGHRILGSYDGRQTGADQPFGQYAHTDTKSQSNTVLRLGAGTYFLHVDAVRDDSASAGAVEVPLGHQGSN